MTTKKQSLTKKKHLMFLFSLSLITTPLLYCDSSAILKQIFLNLRPNGRERQSKNKSNCRSLI